MDEIDLDDWLVVTQHRLRYPVSGDRSVFGAQLRRPFPDAQIWSVIRGDGYVYVTWVPTQFTKPQEV